jgi:ADP-heptose:LPS heptosyltransferase
MKILLWKIGALGDVLMTTPLVRQLRSAWPRAQIDYLVGESCAVMLQGNPHLDRVRVFDEGVLHRAQAHRLPQIVRQLRGYDTVFVLDKHWIFGLSAWSARVPSRIGFARRPLEGSFHTRRVPYGGLRHEIDYYLDLAETSGVSVDRHDRALELPPAHECALPDSPYFVLVNAGGNNAGEQSGVRMLGEPVFGSLVEHCAAQGRVVFIGSANEAHRYARWSAAGTENLCGRLTLPQVWSVLRHARHVYTTDCGLMHMAAAVNRQVTAIFGPTHPKRLCPPGIRHVWKDQARYDDRYVVFGHIPKGRRFFEGLTLEDILAAGSVQPDMTS